MHGKTIWSIAGEAYAADFIEYPDKHHELLGWFTCDKLEETKHGMHTWINLTDYIPDVCGIGKIVSSTTAVGTQTRVVFASAGPIHRVTAPPGNTPLDRLKSVLATPHARDQFSKMFGKNRAEAILLGDEQIVEGEAKNIAGRWRVNVGHFVHPRTHDGMATKQA